MSCVSVGMKIGGSVAWKSCLNVFEPKKDGTGGASVCETTDRRQSFKRLDSLG